MRKTLEKILLPLKSANMDFEVHYKKWAPLKSLPCYTTITCQLCTISLSWDILAGVKTFFAPFQGF